jgi:ABC-type phosphate transport system auxiliary subunit
MDKQQKVAEVKARANELHEQIVYLKCLLKPLQTEWEKLVIERLDLEQELTEVKVIPIQKAKRPNKLDARQIIAMLSEAEREELVRQLEVEAL